MADDLYQLLLPYIIPGLTALVIFITRFVKQESKQQIGQTSLLGLKEEFHSIRNDVHEVSKEIQNLGSTNNLHNHMFVENKESFNRLFEKIDSIEAHLIKNKEQINRNSQRLDVIEDQFRHEGYYGYNHPNKGPAFPTKHSERRDVDNNNNSNNLSATSNLKK